MNSDSNIYSRKSLANSPLSFSFVTIRSSHNTHIFYPFQAWLCLLCSFLSSCRMLLFNKLNRKKPTQQFIQVYCQFWFCNMRESLFLKDCGKHLTSSPLWDVMRMTVPLKQKSKSFFHCCVHQAGLHD